MFGTGDNFELRESPAPYKGISGYENAAIRLQGEYFGEIPFDYNMMAWSDPGGHQKRH